MCTEEGSRAWGLALNEWQVEFHTACRSHQRQEEGIYVIRLHVCSTTCRMPPEETLVQDVQTVINLSENSVGSRDVL